MLAHSSLRTQFKKFLGKSVKKAKHLAEEYGEKAVNKVKSVRDEGKVPENPFLQQGCCLLSKFRASTRWHHLRSSIEAAKEASAQLNVERSL